MYYALFYSHLIYGANIWGLTSEKNIKVIETLQNKCTRIITFSEFRSSANPLFISLGFLKVRDSIKHQQLKLAYEYFEKLLPDDICHLFTQSNEIQSTNMLISSYRNNCLSLPAIKTEHSGRKSLRFQCATLWNKFATNKIQLSNDTSLELNRLKSVSHFKHLLKKHFLYSYTQH